MTDWIPKQTAAINHANVLLQAGQLSKAEAELRRAEKIQREAGQGRLYGVANFFYGDLLLARRRATEVVERVTESLPLMKQQNWLLDIGLDELNMARAEARLDQKPGNRSLVPEITQGDFIKNLLDANAEDKIPRGFLALAEIRLETGERSAENREAIETALTEAELRARRGPMPIFMLQAALLRARLCLLPGQDAGGKKSGKVDVKAALQKRDEAAALIRQHGYGRWEPDLAVLTCEIDPSLDNFQTACTRVGTEGWWHLLPRLENLARSLDGRRRFFWKPRPAETLLAPLRQAEQEYHAEREAYLKAAEDAVETPDGEDLEGLEALLGGLGGGDLEGLLGGLKNDLFLAKLPEAVIHQIATDNHLPSDWHQWPPELKAAVVKAIMEAQPPET